MALLLVGTVVLCMIPHAVGEVEVLRTQIHPYLPGVRATAVIDLRNPTIFDRTVTLRVAKCCRIEADGCADLEFVDPVSASRKIVGGDSARYSFEVAQSDVDGQAGYCDFARSVNGVKQSDLIRVTWEFPHAVQPPEDKREPPRVPHDFLCGKGIPPEGFPWCPSPCPHYDMKQVDGSCVFLTDTECHTKYGGLRTIMNTASGRCEAEVVPRSPPTPPPATLHPTAVPEEAPADVEPSAPVGLSFPDLFSPDDLPDFMRSPSCLPPDGEVPFPHPAWNEQRQECKGCPNPACVLPRCRCQQDIGLHCAHGEFSLRYQACICDPGWRSAHDAPVTKKYCDVPAVHREHVVHAPQGEEDMTVEGLLDALASHNATLAVCVLLLLLCCVTCLALRKSSRTFVVHQFYAMLLSLGVIHSRTLEALLAGDEVSASESDDDGFSEVPAAWWLADMRSGSGTCESEESSAAEAFCMVLAALTAEYLRYFESLQQPVMSARSPRADAAGIKNIPAPP